MLKKQMLIEFRKMKTRLNSTKNMKTMEVKNIKCISTIYRDLYIQVIFYMDIIMFATKVAMMKAEYKKSAVHQTHLNMIIYHEDPNLCFIN